MKRVIWGIILRFQISVGFQERSPEYNKGKIDYYTDAGEMRAHAKQFAVTYCRFYPNQPFDPNKMLKLQHVQPKIDRYIGGLTEPAGQSKTWGMDTTPYQQQMNAASPQMMNMINYFVQMLQNRAMAKNHA